MRKNQKIGRWTLLEKTRHPTRGGTYWRVLCECGQERLVYQQLLEKGYSKSCGCYKREYGLLHGVRKTKPRNLPRGVYFASGSYKVLVSIGNKNYYGGSFPTPDQAEQVYLRIIRELDAPNGESNASKAQKTTPTK